MGLSGVLFDLWGTLIIDHPERARPRQEWRTGLVQEVLRAHRLEVDFEAIDKALLSAMAALTAMQDAGEDFDALGRAHLFSAKLREMELPAPPDEALPAITEAITGMHPEYAPVLEPFALSALEELKALGLRTGLVSNAGFTTAPALRKLIERHGLTPYLDALVFSDELQLAKPHEGMFRHALACLGLEAHECAFVGDSPHNDVYGAQCVGMFAVQVGSRVREGITPQAVVADLGALLPTLRGHGLIE